MLKERVHLCDLWIAMWNPTFHDSIDKRNKRCRYNSCTNACNYSLFEAAISSWNKINLDL